MTNRTVVADSPRLKHAWALILAGSLLVTYLQSGCATQPAERVVVSTPPAAPPEHASEGAPLNVSRSPEELDQLVAPIALYPDELVAQVLAAATYPAEIVEADRWLETRSGLDRGTLAKAIDSQPWDNSVKALAQFPSVLAMMDKNLSWTSSLGEAYMNDSQAVMDAVQQMRARAQQAGNLKGTPQQNVTDEGQTVVIEPADPDIVYVPEYDPWLVYGEPVAFYPDWVAVPGLFIGGVGIDFGFGIGIGVFGGFGWGWHHWGADWHHRGIVYNHAPYRSHSPTFSGHHGFAGLGHPNGSVRPGGFHPGAFSGGRGYGTRSGAFSGFNHGGTTQGFAARGRASAGGFHSAGFGGFHGGAGHR